jgi:serine O-acetyltransferase
MPFPEPVHVIVEALLESYRQVGAVNHAGGANLPSMEAAESLLGDLKNLVFPGFYETMEVDDLAVLPYSTAEHVFRVTKGLVAEIHKALTFTKTKGMDAEAVVFRLLKSIPTVREQMQDDVAAMLEGDPAAKSAEEVILAYPGVEAIVVHRLAHLLYELGVPLIPRMMSELIHRKTGIDIHPGAVIGRRFYIDHGTGIVIGETCIIGDDVKLYQGVTLGALSVKKNASAKKRHPTIEDHVTIYSGATILGGETVIGRHSTIGGNVWLTQSVPASSIVTAKPQEHLVAQRGFKVADYSI